MGADPFLGQIQPFAGNWVPRGWALCAGQLMSIMQFQALYSILGTRYGGDGRNNFALPDLRGRTALCAGDGIGLTPRALGQYGGVESVTLTMAEMPSHLHNHETGYEFTFQAAPENGTNTVPSNGDVLASSYHSGTDSSIQWYTESPSALVALGGVQATCNTIVQDSGGSRSHENMQPWLAMNYIIAIQGSYPPHS